MQGIAAVAPLFVGVFFVVDHHGRATALTAVAGFSAVFAGVGIVFGAFSWTACAGDIRRWRDGRTITGRTGGDMFMAPVLVRSASWPWRSFQAFSASTVWSTAPRTTAGCTGVEP